MIRQTGGDYEVVAESAPEQVRESVKQRLANLPRKRKLRMVIEVKAAGAPAVSAEIALPGRKKARAQR